MNQALVRTTRPSGWRPDRLADSIVVLLAMTVVQRSIGFLRGVFFCRWLEPAELGQWDMALGFIELAAPLMMLGLPGSFSRYVEHYRAQGHLRTYLRRVTFVAASAAGVSIAIIAAQRHWFSTLIFGTSSESLLVLLLAAGLVAIVPYHFLSTQLTALRRSRVVSGLEFVNSALFAALALGMLRWWSASVTSILAAYSLACLITASLSLMCLRPIWRVLPESDVRLPQRTLWSKLVPFAIWVWSTNWLANLFELADRYMIIHFSGLSPSQALAEVGNYHSSRVMPLLLVSITGLLGTLITPYLSCDWETKGREAVSARLNLTLKLLAVCLLMGATTILLVAPWLFGVAFQGKFTGGLAVLPLTLTYCVWFGMARVAQKYLWCTERVGLAAAAWLLGLVVNIGLNLWLLPRFGLPGVVVSTAAGNLASLLAFYGINLAQGMRIESGTWIVSLAPALLMLGNEAALIGTVAVLCAAMGTNVLLSQIEKQQLREVWQDYVGRFRLWAAGQDRPVLEKGS